MKTTEAKKLLCPFDKKECIVEKCMLWQNETKYTEIKKYGLDTFTEQIKKEKLEELGDEYVHISATPTMLDVIVKFGIPSKTKYGHCQVAKA